MLPTHVLLPLKHMALDTVEVGEEHIIVHDHSTQQAAGCPVCHTPSTRPHSWYTRTLADAPCVRRVVTLVLRVRRFFCDVAHCPRKIFVERWPPHGVALRAAHHPTRGDVAGDRIRGGWSWWDTLGSDVAHADEYAYVAAPDACARASAGSCAPRRGVMSCGTSWSSYMRSSALIHPGHVHHRGA